MAPDRIRLNPLAIGVSAAAMLVASIGFAPPASGLPSEYCSDVTLVLDESGSINPYETQVRDALHAFLDPLVDSGVSASIVEFGTSAQTVLDFTPITAANLTGVFDPYIDATGTGDVYDSPSQLGAWTNWDDALDEVSQMSSSPPLVLFLTDGDPTAYNLDQSGEPGGIAVGASITEATARAVEEADEIRSNGSHIIAVGVGSALTNAASVDRLMTVAGPDVYPTSGTLSLATTDVVLVPDFADLPEAMALIAQAMCADPGISVEKTVDQTSVVVGTTVTYQITVTNTGNVSLSDVEVTDPAVPECSTVIGDLAVGESTTYTCSTILWGSLTNTATVTGSDPFGTPVGDDDSAVAEVIEPGVGTPGYWKNHPDAWPMLDGGILIGDWNHNWICDPSETCIPLTQAEAMAWLGAGSGDMTWILARALVAAWLNVSAGNDGSCVAATIDSASTWLLAHPPGSGVFGGHPERAQANVWAEYLDDYNNGRLCADTRETVEAQADAEATSNPSEVGTSPTVTPTPDDTPRGKADEPDRAKRKPEPDPSKGKGGGRADD
jgi:uncharacterized repeat protein (TIGR01451 family)